MVVSSLANTTLVGRMFVTGYFLVNLEPGQKAVFLGIAMAAQASVLRGGQAGRRLYVVPDAKASAFERAVRSLVGADNYSYYNRPLPGYSTVGPAPVTGTVLDAFFR